MNQDLLARIDTARRALRGNLLLTGLCRVAMTLVVSIACFFIVDWLAVNRILALGLADTLVRGVLLVVTLIVIGRIAWLTFIAEWRTRRDDDAIALRIEGRHAVLGGRLISTVQLSRQLSASDGEWTSKDLVDGLAAQTATAASSLDFLTIVDRQTLQRMAMAAGAVLLVAAALCAWRPDYAKALLGRLALMPIDYPRATRIVAVSHAGRVPQGEAYSIEIELDGARHIPESAEAEVRFANGRRVTISLSPVADAPFGKRLFRGQVTQALDDFSFRPMAYDARWPRWESVVAVRRPAVGALTVTCTYPAYLGLPPTTGNLGDLRVPEGTQVTIQATVTKPLAQAAIAVRHGDQEPTETILQIGGERKDSITGGFTVTTSGTWALRLEDQDGLSPAQPPIFTLTALPDKAPVVVITAPNQDKLAAPRAKWPLRFTAQDDHGLATAQLRYLIENGEPEPGAVEPPSVAIDLPGLAGPGELSVSKAVEFDLGRLGVQPGQRVAWWIEVADNRSPSANRGVSQRMHFTIVDAETLRKDAERQRQELLDRINRIRDRQKETRDGVQTLLKETGP